MCLPAEVAVLLSTDAVGAVLLARKKTQQSAADSRYDRRYAAVAWWFSAGGCRHLFADASESAIDLI